MLLIHNVARVYIIISLHRRIVLEALVVHIVASLTLVGAICEGNIGVLLLLLAKSVDVDLLVVADAAVVHGALWARFCEVGGRVV